MAGLFTAKVASFWTHSGTPIIISFDGREYTGQHGQAKPIEIRTRSPRQIKRWFRNEVARSMRDAMLIAETSGVFPVRARVH